VQNVSEDVRKRVREEGREWGHAREIPHLGYLELKIAEDVFKFFCTKFQCHSSGMR
jgi:hypothetical protein